jgi:hypothetical protein
MYQRTRFRYVGYDVKEALSRLNLVTQTTLFEMTSYLLHIINICHHVNFLKTLCANIVDHIFLHGAENKKLARDIMEVFPDSEKHYVCKIRH